MTREAEDAWMELLLSAPSLGVIGSPDCTPGYYNNEGHPGGVVVADKVAIHLEIEAVLDA